MTTLENNNLNEKEIMVLSAIVEAHGNAGGDFTYANEVHLEIEERLTINQVKGYLSQLTQKGFIMICDEYNQINFLDTIYSVFPDLDDEAYCAVFGENGNV